jgi:CRP-like cAMP-binding protein
VAQNLASATGRISIDGLRKIEVFADLPREQLDWLAEHLQEMHFQPGEIMGREGEPLDNLTVILEGEIRMQRGSWRR